MPCTTEPACLKGFARTGTRASRSCSCCGPGSTTERWKQNCGILRIDVPLTPEELCAITVELARRNDFRTDLYIRPLAYKCAERIGVAIDDQDAFAIVALPFGEYLHSENGLHAGVSSWRRIEDNAIPPRAKICGAYANSALASDEAHRSRIR